MFSHINDSRVDSSNAIRAAHAVAPNLAYPPQWRLPTTDMKPLARSKCGRRRRGAPPCRRHARDGGRFPVRLPLRARNRLCFGPPKHFRVGRYMANRGSINSKTLPQWVYLSAVQISTLEPFNLFESLSNRMRDPTKNLFYLPLYCVAHQCRGVSKSDDLPPHPAFQNATPRRLPVTTPFVSLIVTPFQLTIAHHGAAVSEVWGLVSLSLRRPSRSGDASTMEYCSGIQVWDN